MRQQIFLACEFLAVEYPLPALPFSSGETTDWEDLAVSAVPESRRLAAHQQTVFKAWAIKRAVEQGTFWQTPHHPARLIAACRDYLLGVGSGSYEPELWQTVEKTAAELLALPQSRVPPPAGEGPALPSDLKRVSMRTAGKKGPKVYSSDPSAAPKKRR
ncbi:MAG: hypothetical protein ACUVRM_09735 [Bacillota bacterium]